MNTFKKLFNGLLILISTSLSGQDFELTTPPLPAIQQDMDILFQGIPYLVDYDNDGDNDVLLNNRIYKNEPNEVFQNYVELDLGFTSFDYAKSFDMDNDGDLDILIAFGGAGFEAHPIKLFENDGTGNFSELADTPFIGGYFNYIETGDVNNDGNIDVLISSGYFFDGSISTILYVNNGNNDFSIQETDVMDVNRGYLRLVDLDGDNDLDLLAHGQPNGGGHLTKSYKNDGTGVFTEYSSGLANIQDSKLETSDIDNDGDLDVVVIGRESSAANSKVYKNDGAGFFTVSQTLAGVSSPSPDGWGIANYSGSVSFGDLDNDGDEDLIIAGYTDLSSVWDSHLYLNNGSGIFTENTQDILDLDNYAYAHIMDIDNDGIKDIFQTTMYVFAHRSFINQGGLEFKLASGSYIDGNIFHSQVLTADFENDGDLDVFVYGRQNFQTEPSPYNGLFINNGHGIFTEEVSNLNFNHDIFFSKFLDIADTDNDGDVDIFVYDNETPQLFINNGANNFTEQTNFGVLNISTALAKFFDYNNDGLMDLLAGSTIFQNTGSNQFTEVFTLSSNIENAIIGDYDNNGYLDIVAGVGSNTSVFYNDGAGSFTQSTDGTFTVDYSWSGTQNLFIEDINNDGYLDFIFTYGIFINDGTNHLTQDNSNDLTINFNPIIQVVDINDDGFVDVITKKSTSYSNLIHYNDGTGTLEDGVVFEEETLRDLMIPGDFDNDNDIDFIGLGHNPIGVFKCYLNDLYNPSSIVEEETTRDSKLIIYPNPSDDLISLRSPIAIAQIIVYDEKGKTILSTKYSNKISLTNVPKGVYLIKTIDVLGNSEFSKVVRD